MPFTPFHFGPGLLGGVLFDRQLDPLTFVIASVVVDVRATLVLFDVLGGRLHGPLHTFAGATVLGALLAGGVVLAGRLVPLREWFSATTGSLRYTLAGGLAGTWLHVALDAVLYTDIRPFAPVHWNPLYGIAGPLGIYGLCLVAFVVAGGLVSARRLNETGR